MDAHRLRVGFHLLEQQRKERGAKGIALELELDFFFFYSIVLNCQVINQRGSIVLY